MLVVRGLTVQYRQAVAVEGVDLKVDMGQCVCLVGPNGAGKTTVVNSLCGLVEVVAGQVLFAGRDVSDAPPHERAALGMALVPEGRRVFPAMSVERNLRMGAYRERDEGAVRRSRERVFELFPVLAERRNQLGGTLSGGEQQMLAIGRALMANPRLLLLDEPSTGLAPVLVERIFEVIARLHEAGLSILLVEQNARMAFRVAERAYVIQVGRIVLSGSREEMLADDRVRQAYLGI